MIVSYKSALNILKDRNHTNSRTDFLMQQWEDRSGTRYEKIRGFHASWLMYSDGHEHDIARKSVLSALSLSPTIDILPVLSKLEDFLASGSLEEAHAREIALIWHRNFLGLSVEQQTQVFSIADPFLKFDLPPIK